MKTSTKRYEAPQAEVIALESLNVLCGSGGHVTSKGAGTTSMGMSEITGFDVFIP